MTPDFDLVDAHQHFWDPTRNYHPWLNDLPMIPFRYGDYSAIRRPYLPADYLADASPWRIGASVYIETEWNPADPLGEMRYVDELRRTTGWPAVAVGQAWLDRADCASVLESLRAWPFVRGIRHKPRANPRPNDAAPGGMTDPAWRAGYALLARSGLHFELQTPWWHLHEAARLASDFPDLPIVLNHTGLPADRSVAGLAAWKRAMTTLAGCRNVSVKISGIGQAGLPWTVAANRDIVLATIEAFGAARCMFASNFPVDSLTATFDTIFSGFSTITQALSASERRALFRDNALRIYRMETP